MQRQAAPPRAALKFRATAVALIVVHLGILWWLTMLPPQAPWVEAANLQPLETIRAELVTGGWQAVADLGGPLLALAPLGLLLPLAGGRVEVSPLGSFLRTAGAGALISLAFELLKTAIPGQVADVDTLLLNTAGIMLAHLAVVPAVRARLRREEPVPVAAQGETPRITRVGIAP